MSTVDGLLANNRAYAEDFDRGDRSATPSKRVAVVACMDALMDVYRLLGLELGEAHVIRNAGGVVSEDVIRSLIISQHMLGTREIALIHHTNCGMCSFTDAELKQRVEAETGIRPPFAMESFDSPEDDVRQSKRRIEANPLLPHTDAVRAFVYDVTSGELREVE